MRWFAGLVVICAALLASWHAVGARDDVCGAAGPMRVAVHPVFANTVYDFSYSVEDIQGLANDAVHRVRQGWALGLTRYEPTLTMTAPIEAVAASDGTFCARPASVDVDLGYKDMTVTIPSELDGSSCGFEQILRHEDEHVDVSEHMLRKYLPLMRARLEDEIKRDASARLPTAEDAVALERNMLNAALVDIARQMADETAALQQDVDSPEEYHRMLDVCGGELADLVKTTRAQQMASRGF